jgi:hypothetical protein
MTNHINTPSAYLAQLEAEERETNKKLRQYIILFLVTMALIVPSAIANGYVLSTLWGWFMVPIFGLPALGIVAAMGVMTVVSYMTASIRYAKDDRDTSEQVIEAIVYAIVRPSMALLVGYIIKSFM